MSPKTQFAVLGAGSWGSALAILLARNGHPVWLWGRDAAKMQALADAQCNPWYLPDAHFPEGLVPTSDLNHVLATTSEVIMVTPSKVFRPILETVAVRRSEGFRFAWATKGLEPKTQRPFHEVAKEILGENVPTAVLSGPTFAREVALGLPTAITVASHFPEYANWLAGCLSSSVLRPYTSEDVIGVEIGGAAKNVLAIAAGISDGLGFGDNARAALITRGLTEIMRLGEALGARRETLMGLSGLGDLVLTCTGDLSRNRRFGLLLGKGYPIDSALKVIGQVVEGFSTVREVVTLANRLQIPMPITEQVYSVLYLGHSPRESVQNLFSRALRPESK
ncbi:glycerol-3-phosphate dehydrogenase [Gammaproteobacteria bacterium]